MRIFEEKLLFINVFKKYLLHTCTLKTQQTACIIIQQIIMKNQSDRSD